MLTRLYSHAAKAASKLAAARREADNPKDESTGVPLFAPQIGRAPNYSRNHAALPIGDYLYGMRCAIDDKGFSIFISVAAHFGSTVLHQSRNHAALPISDYLY